MNDFISQRVCPLPPRSGELGLGHWPVRLAAGWTLPHADAGHSPLLHMDVH